MCSLTMQTEGAMNLIVGTSHLLMSAYKWEACGSLRVLPQPNCLLRFVFDPYLVPVQLFGFACAKPTALSLLVARWDSFLFHCGFFSKPFCRK